MYSVLLVEDEVLVSAGLKHLVPWKDMDMAIVGEASNGKNGLEMYHEKHPDLILTDIKMPIMSGLEMIEEIRKEDQNTKIVVLTSFDDFDLVRQAFKLGVSDYILKLQMMPEEIEKVIRKVHEELEKSGNRNEKKEVAIEQIQKQDDDLEACRQFVVGEQDDVSLFRKQAEALNLAEDCVCVLRMKYDGSQEKKEDKISCIILELIHNLLLKLQAGAVWAEEKEEFLILFSLPKERQEEKEQIRKELLSKIHLIVRSRVNKNVWFGVSSFGNRYELLPALYGEAGEMLEISSFFEKEAEFYGEDKKESSDRLWEEFGALTETQGALSSHCLRKIQKEVVFLKKKTALKPDEIKGVLMRWVNYISFDRGIRTNEEMDQALETVEQMRKMKTFRELKKGFEEYLKQNFENRDERKLLSKEVSETISYINAHYCESDISLPDAAKHVMLQKNYLSRLFKNEVGVNFTEYINMQRIRKAQELLSTTHKKSYEIAFEIGFQDESYFSRVFKKQVGISPNEYKKKYDLV